MQGEETNLLKRLFSWRKQPVSEYTEGISKVREYSDGSFEITMNKEPGSVNGVHYTGYVEQVRQLKREKKHQEAIEILLKLVDATESESKIAGPGFGVAPWYYEQLAILYRKEKRYEDEVSILERYMAQTQAPGVGPNKLTDRLLRAKELRNKQLVNNQ